MARKPRPGAPSVAAQVRDYIDTHPSIKDCLTDGLVNLSALTRQIMKEKGISKEEAVLVACRRYQDASPRHSERTIKRTLSKSRVEVSSRVAIVTLRNDWKLYERLYPFLRKTLSQGHIPKLIQGSKAITLITDEGTAATVREELGAESLLALQTGLVELSVTSPEQIRTTPGIMAFLYGSLSSNGINILETMSTYTDTIFIVAPGDMSKAFEVLSRCIQG